MGKQENIAAMQRFAEGVNSGNFEVFQEVMAPDIVDHDPAPDQGPGPEGFVGFFRTMRTAFPDLAVAMEHMVADDENIAFAYTITGTHRGEFQGVAPTGRRVRARGMQISRFENGRMVERWGSSDELGILKQIGGVATVTRADGGG